MSRIGNKIIELPENVKITFVDGLFTAKFDNKEESLLMGKDFDLSIEDNSLKLTRLSESKEIKSKHGLF